MERLRVPQKPLKRAGLFVGGGIAALAIACSGGNGTEPKVQNGATLTPPDATATIKPNSTPNATVVPTEAPTIAPTETPAPTEAPVVNCEILPPNICGSAEVIDWTGADGTKFTALGFKNVPPGTRIASLINAVVHPGRLGEGSKFKGMTALVNDVDGIKRIRLIGDIGFENPESSHNVNVGDTITTIQGTGVDNFGYNLIISITKQSENGTEVDDIETLEKYFPGITSKTPSGTVKIDSNGTVLSNFEYID